MKLSIVIITNNKRPLNLVACISSAKTVAEEVIIVGNVSDLEHHSDVILIDEKELANVGNISKMRNMGADVATGDYIINCDDDIIFTPLFKRNFINFISKNPNVPVFTTKVIGSNGGRYWDRAVHRDSKSWMIDYDAPYDNDLYYSGAFIIRNIGFADKYKWNESNNFNFVGKNRKTSDCEDIEYSQRIHSKGYKLNIDLENYVIHWDDRYITYMSGDGFLVCDKQDDLKYKGKLIYENVIYDEKLFKIIKAIIASFNLNG